MESQSDIRFSNWVVSNESDSAGDTNGIEIEDIEEVPQQLISSTATQTEEFNYFFKSGSGGNGRVFDQIRTIFVVMMSRLNFTQGSFHLKF